MQSKLLKSQYLNFLAPLDVFNTVQNLDVFSWLNREGVKCSFNIFEEIKTVSEKIREIEDEKIPSKKKRKSPV